MVPPALGGSGVSAAGSERDLPRPGLDAPRRYCVPLDMHLSRCPICHSRINLEALVQDEAGRELLALVARLDTQTGAALVTYLGLFRSPTRDLANERALRLARETLDMTTDTARLAIALSETTEALRGKQSRQPLKNHNYLKKVLESVQARPVIAETQQGAVAPRSKTGQALLALQALKK